MATKTSKSKQPKRSGYTQCACRDCFEIAISNDETKPALCSECSDAGCDGGECQRADAYGCGQ